MKLLHTSDWHLGRTLYGKKRYEEFEAFLGWLEATMEREEIDALLVAGDIFDNSAPSNRAQELYYRFLCRAAASSCRHVVVIAGNHDSPSFLNAPKELLKALDVHVVGCSQAPEDEVLVLRDGQGTPELIVCAVPYLRDRDIRAVEVGESIEDKERKLTEGIRDHYAAVAGLAKEKREAFGKRKIPIVGMGHLFAAGGQTVEGDGVRELYVGSLAHVPAGVFPACFDYVALGHLHAPQMVNGSEIMRYSGSPLPMGFGEAKQQKSVCRVEFHGTEASVHPIGVPTFQTLERVKGSWDDVSARILELSATGSQAWLEIEYDGKEILGNLRERLEAAVEDTRMEILRVRDNRIVDRALKWSSDAETLDDLDVNDVFERCLVAHEVPEAQRGELTLVYKEALASLEQDDAQAE